MGKHEELIKIDKTMFSNFSYRNWCDYYMSLNAELPPDNTKRLLRSFGKKGQRIRESQSITTCQNPHGLID